MHAFFTTAHFLLSSLPFSHRAAANAVSASQSSAFFGSLSIGENRIAVSFIATITILYRQMGLIKFSMGSSSSPACSPCHWSPS